MLLLCRGGRLSASPAELARRLQKDTQRPLLQVDNPLKKMLALAMDGITSFSTLPLRLWSYVGSCISLLALAYAGYLVADKVLFGNAVPGYPSLMTAILFLGGVQLIGIGILGEYVGRIYMEAKHRPRYVVKEVIRGKATQEGMLHVE